MCGFECDMREGGISEIYRFISQIGLVYFLIQFSGVALARGVEVSVPLDISAVSGKSSKKILRVPIKVLQTPHPSSSHHGVFSFLIHQIWWDS